MNVTCLVAATASCNYLACRKRIASKGNRVSPRGIENFGEIDATSGVIIEVVIYRAVAIPDNIDMDCAGGASAGEMDVARVTTGFTGRPINAGVVESRRSRQRQRTYHECSKS